MMRLFDDMKDDKNQLDLSKLCRIMTEEEKQEDDSKLLKLSKSVAIVARIKFS